MDSTVQILRKEYSGWIEELTDEELHAIRKYSYNSFDKKPNRFFERLNRMLRGQGQGDEKEKLEGYADIISRALRKHPLEHEITCYRGIDFDICLNTDPGAIIRFNQFVSTSVVRTRALNGLYELVIRAPKGTPGAYIERISHYPLQREFLIDRNVSVRLTEKDGFTYNMEVIV